MPIAPLPPALMVQGTSSNAGKSLLVAALCRIFARQGLNVAPFKAQNMSLNSWVVNDEGEMGIAQAVQARAANLAPSVLMNPVLLKPMGHSRSQIIILGKPTGILTYKEYTAQKSVIWSEVAHAYAELSKDRDLMLLEGAGSPAEINLRANDIVNMAMAHHADARVLLCADIDRGGAFASLAGTVVLLDKRDRRRISGFVLNKFRGDQSLLAPALAMLSKKCRRPFFGVIPMLENLLIPEEDSMGSTLPRHDSSQCLDIAIINLPAISNTSDRDPLVAEKHIRCRLVHTPQELGSPHVVILPGSRNVPIALSWLKQSGLFHALQAHARKIAHEGRGQIVGICAGLQLLGETIADPANIEGGGIHGGLALLPLTTTLLPAKTLSQINATIQLDGEVLPCHGREIHHGQCETPLPPLISGSDGRPLGWGNQDGVWGTWLHGIFDNDQFRHHWLRSIARQFGIEKFPLAAFDPDQDIERLANEVEAALDMTALCRLVQKRK